jgi:hypothetical protein
LPEASGEATLSLRAGVDRGTQREGAWSNRADQCDERPRPASLAIRGPAVSRTDGLVGRLNGATVNRAGRAAVGRVGGPVVGRAGGAAVGRVGGSAVRRAEAPR